MKKLKNKIALFIMPRPSTSWKGSEALWITIAGWATAAEKKFGKAYVLTQDRFALPKEVYKYPLEGKSKNINIKASKFLPSLIKTIIKDILLWKKSKSKKNYNYQIPGLDGELELIFEQHDLFQGPGVSLAKKYKVPLVKKLDGLIVWEAEKWGVKRYAWGWFLERFVEVPALKKADIIACVSQNVFDKCLSLGIPKDKLFISPMAVDPYLFRDQEENIILKNNLGLKNEFVVGWIGSFRSFHGLDHVVKAFEIVHESYPNTKLLLVGGGFEEEKIKKLVDTLHLSNSVIFAGRQDFLDIPNFVALFDVALVSAKSATDFHYSPLKLREYMGAGIASIAPRAGEIPVVFTEEKQLLLYEAGSAKDMAAKILFLYENDEVKKAIAKEGRRYIKQNGTWKSELEKLMNKIQ